MARRITRFGAVPVIIKPPMPTRSAVWTRMRVERLTVCAAGVALGVGVGVWVGVAVGVGSGVAVGGGVGVPPTVAVGVAVAVAVGVGDGVPLGLAVALGVGVTQEAPKISEKRLSVPVSIPALSDTFNVQLPLAFCPSNADNGLSGAKLPLTAPVVGMVEAGGKPPSSSSKTVQ